MKRCFSLIILAILFINNYLNTVNAHISTKKVRVVVTYPISDAWLWVDSGWLVHEPTLWILFRFALKDSWWATLCMEEKVVPVVNWIITYEIGSQYAININWVITWCNMDSLINNYDYKIVVTWDLNKNNTFTDPIDYVSLDAVWTESTSQQFDASYLDSKTLDIQNNVVSWNWWSTAIIDYNISAGLLNNDLIASWNKTKTFDLNWDGSAEVFAVPYSGWDGMIYAINKVTWSLENIITSPYITIDDSTNIFVVWRLWNFVLHWILWTDSNATITNIPWKIVAYQNWSVVETSQTIKEFVAFDYVTINLSWKDTTFKFNPLSRQYEEKVSIPLWPVYDIYDSVVSTDWVWTPFATNTADYYGWDVRVADINGTVITDIDWQVLWDFNQDWRLDSITWKNTTWWMAYFTIHLQKIDWSYKDILVNVLGDWVTAWTSILDNSWDFWWTDINELIFTNWNTKNVYKINWNWETADVWDWPYWTVMKIASFDSSFYAILSKNGGTVNINESFFSIWDWFRDMNDTNINDKFLLIWNFKVKKDWYDYYDYYIQKYNWTEFVDLLMDDWITSFKWTGNKIGFTKIGNSDFYTFYVDKSTHYTKWLQDKTNLFQVYSGKVVKITSDVIVNDNNTVIGQDWLGNEWGSKFLSNSTFWINWQNISAVNSLYLWINNLNFSSMSSDYTYNNQLFDYVEIFSPVKTNAWTTILNNKYITRIITNPYKYISNSRYRCSTFNDTVDIFMNWVQTHDLNGSAQLSNYIVSNVQWQYRNWCWSRSIYINQQLEKLQLDYSMGNYDWWYNQIYVGYLSPTNVNTYFQIDNGKVTNFGTDVFNFSDIFDVVSTKWEVIDIDKLNLSTTWLSNLINVVSSSKNMYATFWISESTAPRYGFTYTSTIQDILNSYPLWRDSNVYNISSIISNKSNIFLVKYWTEYWFISNNLTKLQNWVYRDNLLNTYITFYVNSDVETWIRIWLTIPSQDSFWKILYNHAWAKDGYYHYSWYDVPVVCGFFTNSWWSCVWSSTSDWYVPPAPYNFRFGSNKTSSETIGWWDYHASFSY